MVSGAALNTFSSRRASAAETRTAVSRIRQPLDTSVAKAVDLAESHTVAVTASASGAFKRSKLAKTEGAYRPALCQELDMRTPPLYRRGPSDVCIQTMLGMYLGCFRVEAWFALVPDVAKQ